MLKRKSISQFLLSTLLMAGGIWNTGMAAEAEPASQILDVCGTCHSAAPTPSNHVPVASASVTLCLTCHDARPGDKLLIRVHERHLAMSMQCATCHAGNPPQRSALDALLQASGAR